MKLHAIEGYIQNIHLAEYEHGCMLLDGCCRVDLATIEDYFYDVLKRPITDLKVIVVTHMHPDHAGCALALQKRSGAVIYSGQAKGQWYSGFRGSIAHVVDIALALWVAGRLGKKWHNIWYPKILTPTKALADNEAIPGFEDWHIIKTPGHTAQDISLVNDSNKLIYVADVIVKVKKQLVPPFPVYYPEAYKQSLRRIGEYCGYTLLMAHVAPIKLEQHMIDGVVTRAPDAPKTNWIAIKHKVMNTFSLGK